jgi:hypothetical protein
MAAHYYPSSSSASTTYTASPAPGRPRAATLETLPEELLEKILAHALTTPPKRARASTTAALAASLPPLTPSPSGSPSSSRPYTPPPPQSPHGALLTNRALARIGSPLSLRHVDLSSTVQQQAFAAFLLAHPDRGAHVRSLVLYDALDASVPALLKLCPRLDALELALPSDDAQDTGAPSINEAECAERLGRALAHLRGVRTLTLRKGVYLTGPRCRAVLSGLAFGLPYWPLVRIPPSLCSPCR